MVFKNKKKNTEWKDAQFKEYLEKKKLKLSCRSDWVGFHSNICERLLDEIINELFCGTELDKTKIESDEYE